MKAAAITLAAGLALCGCAGIGLDGLDHGDEATEPVAETPVATPPGPEAGGGPSLPLPRPTVDAPEGDAVATAASTEGDTEAPAEDATAAPHVYMAVQPDRGGPVSVVFAIDRSRDNTPSDEPAIRITPEQTETSRGRCNPQQLRYYNFPPESAERPLYGPDEAARGIGAKELPGFMATAVSSEMIDRGIADELEQTRPQNVCTRKLFEQTIVAASTGQG